jgi:hypothetical protein
MNRRRLLQNTSTGFGWLAFNALNAQWTQAATKRSLSNPLAPSEPHHEARAKRVIFMFMNGGPSHLETFDHKPELARAAGGGSRYLAPAFDFSPHGRSGLMISDAFPNLAGQADELCLLNGMTTNNPSHQQAVVALHTGNEMFVRPSMGSWVVYGLGSEAEDLPGFVTINPIGNQGGAMNYGSAFLPATFQGTRISGGGGGLANMRSYRLSDSDQRRQLDFIRRANERLAERDPGNPELEGVIQSYELAYKMQTSVPETLSLNSEPGHVRELYGLNDGASSEFGMQCLMARRLAEKGVRFIQVTSNGWDHHNKIREGIASRAAAIDKPMAGLIADLKQRDLLKDTLIVWGGEFGRGTSEDNGGGRGHNAKGFSMWMAGGGVKGGHVHGSTDDLGGEAVDGVMGTHDLHATILHLLGLNHERLTYRYAGRKFRLTDTSGVVAKDIIA